VGGYDDWLRQRASPDSGTAVPPRRGVAELPKEPTALDRQGGRKKLSYTEQREFDRLPGHIEALEAELQQLNAAIAAPEFYRETPEAIRQAFARVEELHNLLLQSYALWDDLDSRKM
jgi:ATP-binding cassette subfamily F protein uup